MPENQSICSFSDCELHKYCKGLCSGHYQQKNRGAELTELRQHRPKGVMPHRFVVVSEQGCHVFRGYKDSDGYGIAAVKRR